MLAELFERNYFLSWLAAIHLLIFLVLLALSIIDKSEIAGANRWHKPMKFAISIAIYLFSVAWLSGYLQAYSGSVSTISWTIFITMVLETIIITGQAARMQKSHFNNENPLGMILFMVMGIAIFINTLALVWLTILFFGNEVTAFISGTELSAPFLWSIRLGLILTIAGSMVGGIMGARNRHTVGVGVEDSERGLFFLNWSRKGGDLRIAHFLGLHALQILPLFGYLVSTYPGLKGTVLPVIVFSILYLGIFTILLLHALAARPLLRERKNLQIS